MTTSISNLSASYHHLINDSHHGGHRGDHIDTTQLSHGVRHLSNFGLDMMPTITDGNSSSLTLTTSAGNITNMTTSTGDELDLNVTRGMLIDAFLSRDRIFDHQLESHLITAYTIMVILGIFTNLVIMVLILCRKNQRTGSNLLILNLAASDIMMAALSPVTLLSLLNRSWHYGSLLCKLSPFIQGIEIFVSSLTVTAIAIDRMLRITNISFLTWRPGASYKSVVRTTVGIWITAVALSAPVTISYEVQQVGEPNIFVFEKCMESWTRSYSIGYTLVILFTQLIVPTTALVTSYSVINRYLSRQSFSGNTLDRSTGSQGATTMAIEGTGDDVDGRPSPRLPRGSADTGSLEGTTAIELETVATRAGDNGSPFSCVCLQPVVGEITSGNSTGCHPAFGSFRLRRVRQHRDNQRNRRAVLALMGVWLCFVVSWSPWNFLQLYVEIWPNVDLSPRQFNLLFVTCHLMAMSSTITNGILYGFFNTNIRAELNVIRARTMKALATWNARRRASNAQQSPALQSPEAI